MSATPVFVDASGRRAAVVTRTCWALAGLAMGYVVLVVVALVAPSNVFPLQIPGLPTGTAPVLTTTDGETHPPAALATSLPTPSRRPVTPPGLTTAPGRSTATPAARSAPVATPRPGATSRPTTAPSAASAPPGRAVGKPTAKPRPSKPPHP